MTPTKLNRAPLTKRISALAITAAAAFTFVISSPTAHAAKPTKEFTAVQAALAAQTPPQTFATANGTQLAQAVLTAIADPANAKLKPGNIAGEALKNAGTNAQVDGGTKIGDALITGNAGDDVLAARDAIKRAGSGANLNVNLVPDFTTKFVNTDAQAYSLAKQVISTKPGAGAVIGGRASMAGVNATDLVNNALPATSKGGAGLSAATQDILKYVVAEIDSQAGGNGATDDFTLQIASTQANINLAPKIGTGGVAGDPTNGGNIVNKLLGSASLPKLRTGITPFMNTVGKVADIEEISRIAAAVGNQIATVSGNTTAIKFSAANSVVKSLAKAIIAKATTTNNAADINSWDNKEDEIAEVAAYMVGKILNTSTVQGVGGGKPQVTIKNAGSKIFAIVMSAVNVTKGKKIALAAPTLNHDAAIDVAGSVAETLASLREDPSTASISDTFFDAIKAFLVAKAKAIGGAANAQAVADAINAAYEQTGPSLPDLNFEDGTKDGTLAGLPLSPGGLPARDETDTRPN